MEYMVLVIFVSSWLLLRLEGRGLAVLGFDQPGRRLAEAAAGWGWMTLAAALQQCGYALATATRWRVNPEMSAGGLAGQVFWDVRSVLIEELLFRGYALYLLLRFAGPRRALWIDATAFGVYHWFTFGVLGNLPAMLAVLVFTGAFGFVLALAFRQTGSLALPIGLHLGWNLTVQSVFSGGVLGKSLLIPISGVVPLHAEGLPGVALGVLLPLAAVGLVALWLLRKPHVARIQSAQPIDTVRSAE